MTTADLAAVAAEECERLSLCCSAQEHSDLLGASCGECWMETAFECSRHEVEWNDDGICPGRQAEIVRDGAGFARRRP